MEEFNNYFQESVIWKALAALLAGIILGYERESKDKSAGLKTISIITIGSFLFAILSENYSGRGDSFSIAAGIISGVGFLGAGVIFKEGFTIYGLTTAGIIWVSAAIGMSIGFGEFYIAFIFLAIIVFIIYGVQFIGRVITPNNNSKGLKVILEADKVEEKELLLKSLSRFTKYQNVTKIEKLENQQLSIYIDIHIRQRDISTLENFLFDCPKVIAFSL